MLILIIVVCGIANLLMTFMVGSMVNQLTFNKDYLETIKRLERLKRAHFEKPKEGENN
jgi:hypothetical protein